MRTVFGYYGHNNVGDEAFKSVFEHLFPNEPIEFLSQLGAMPREDVIFGGGAVINKYFTQHLASVDNIYALGCSLPHGPGDVVHLELLRERLRTLYLRSQADVDAALTAGFAAQYIPDLTFSLEPRAVRAPEALCAKYSALTHPDFGKKDKNIIVIVSDDYTLFYGSPLPPLFEVMERFKDVLAQTLDELSAKFNIIFVPFSVWYNARDYAAAMDIIRRMKNRHLPCAFERVMGPQAVLDLVSSLNGIVLSMKYHGLVFGLLGDSFTINMGSTRKNLDLMRELGLAGLSMNRRTVTKEALLATVEKHADSHLRERARSGVAHMRAVVRMQLNKFRSEIG